jgi:hypothetical protein
MNKKNHEPKDLPEGAIISTPFRYSNMAKFARFSPKNYKYKKPVLIGLVVCALIVGGIIALSLRKPKVHETIALQVGKYSYTQTQYNKLIAQAKGMNVSEYEARKALKEAFATRQAADDLKISYPTDQSTLNAEAARNFKLLSANPSINDYQRDTAYTELIKPFVAIGMHGGYSVGYVEFPFSRYIAGGNDSQFHNTKLINDDITYAKNQAQQYRDAIASKKQSISKVIDKVRADQRLVYGQAGNISDEFFTDENGSMYSAFSTSNTVQSPLLKAIKQAEVGKVSDIMTRSMSNSTGLNLPSIQHGTDVDVAYYFIIVESKTTARPSLDKDFNARKQGYL